MKRLLRIIFWLAFILLVAVGGFQLGMFTQRFSGFIFPAQSQPAVPPQEKIEQLPLSPAARLYGLSQIWEKGRSSFPFFQQRPNLNWDRAYQEHIPLVLAASDDLAYYRVLQHYAALLQDGHSRVLLPPALQERLAQPAAALELIGGQYYLSGLAPDFPQREKLLGARLLAVDGRPAAELAGQLSELLPASTPQDLSSRTAQALLEGPRGSLAVLSLEALSGEQVEISLPRWAPQRSSRPPLETRELAPGIILVSLRSFANPAVVEQFNQAFPTFKGVRALIFDLRNNGGGNSGYGDAIFRRLITLPVENVRWRTRQRTAYMDAARYGEQWFDGPPGLLWPARLTGQFTGEVLVLVNARTYSAAENFAALFQITGRGTLIGQPTGGSTGQPIFFDLPGGGNGAILTKWDYYPDGTEFVGIGIQPEVRVDITPKDLSAGRDGALEKALEMLRVEP